MLSSINLMTDRPVNRTSNRTRTVKDHVTTIGVETTNKVAINTVVTKTKGTKIETTEETVTTTIVATTTTITTETDDV
jgi:hypothetical protein